MELTKLERRPHFVEKLRFPTTMNALHFHFWWKEYTPYLLSHTGDADWKTHLRERNTHTVYSESRNIPRWYTRV